MTMRAMTASNLRSAYGGESMAHMRYITWGEKAEKDGFPNVGRLFRAVSYAEQIHATGHFAVMKNEGGGFAVTAGGGFGIGTTSENLAGAIEGETHEIEEMYPTYIEVAKLQNEKAAVRQMEYALEVEKIHADLYKKAKKAVDGGQDMKLGKVQICEVCGHTHEGDAPDKCPICGAKKNKYREFA